MQNWEPLLLCRSGGVVSACACPIDGHLIGKKAIGLGRIPKQWTLPYLIVSIELYLEWRATGGIGRSALIGEWVEVIQQVFGKDEHYRGGLIIVRSSGNDEGMSSRGGYYSKRGQPQFVGKLLTECLENLERDPDISDTEVALIIQTFREPKAKGHLSNERRCYEERRDWLGQTEQLGQKPPYLFTINLRKWRQGSNTNALDVNASLGCPLEEAISSNLKTVAHWFYETTERRYHLEWVWDGSNVFVVQADEEGLGSGIDPTKPTVIPACRNALAGLKVVQPLSDAHAARYAKIRNVQIYRRLGLPTAPLFVLDDPTVIENIAAGRFSRDLTADLRLLVRSPLVIRTDIVEPDHTKRQLLKRSDELRSYKAAREWLINAARSLIHDTDACVQVAFLFHNFIPATSSAFVYAEPRKRFVQIEGLWGLPEGLYYNSHDQFMVDTLRPSLRDATSVPLESYVIKEKCNFKNFFVAPDKTGRWTRQLVAPPWDWRPSISKELWLRKMAIDSRKIVEEEGCPLSIMWFVDLGGATRESKIMPWFHEPFDSTTIRHRPIHSRRKNVWEVSFEVKTSEDLALLEEMVQSRTQSVKRIKVSPVEDHLLRDKHALQKIGDLAKALDATIVLEGAILSHAYYQLASTEAVVEVVHPFIGFEEKHAYNKLVRDKIPERIEGLGETVMAGKLEPAAFLAALRSKLIEEAYEVQDAGDAESILEELADIQEVIIAILKCIGRTPIELEQRRAEKMKQRGGFDDGMILLSTSTGIAAATTSEAVRELTNAVEEQTEFDFGNYSDTADAIISINQAALKEVSERIDRWADARTGDNWREAIASIQVPVANTRWESATRRIETSNGETVTSTVSARRVGARIFIELRARTSLPEPDLFSMVPQQSNDPPP